MTGHKSYQPVLEAGLMEEIIRRVVDVARPDKLILFGSRARGDHRPDSYIDLLVIQESKLPRHRRAAPIYRALAGLPAAVDLEVIVYTSEELPNGVR